MTHKAKFVAKYPQETGLFQRMVNYVSTEARMNRLMVKNMGEKAIHTWEIEEKQNILNIFEMEPVERAFELEKILNNFRNYLSPIAPSGPNLDKAIIVAEGFFRMIFNPA